jgi:hypothetical protein
MGYICGHMTVYDGICQGGRIPDVLLHCNPNSAAGRRAQFHGKGIYQVYTRYRMAIHMTGIYQVYDMYMTYGIYLVYTCHMTMFSFDRYIPGIYQVYT